MAPPSNPDDLIRSTIEHYRRNAASFWEGTKDHDVSQNIRALLDALPAQKPLTILDFGCGPGRDLMQFKRMGHTVIGLDACPEFCEMARSYADCEVLNQDFRELHLPESRFDGIFANASLFHVPKADLPRVLKELHRALKPEGVLFSSNPRGNGEYFDGTRYGFYTEFEEYGALLAHAGFKVIGHYYRPVGMPRDEQHWLAVVSRRD